MTENIAGLFEAVARALPGKPVLVDDAGALIWSMVERRAGALAGALAASGVGRGDRVALAIAEPLPMVIGLLGALKTGATVAPINPRLTASERDAILADLSPRLVIDSLAPGEAEFAATAVHGADTAIVLYTSGSTGLPKGVELSHAACAAGLDSWKGPVMDLGPDDVALSALPLAHSLGLFGSVLAPLLAGATVAFVPRFAPEQAIAAISRWGVTVFPGVATMFRRILESPAFSRARLASLRYALSGAAPCPWELARDWRATSGSRIVRGYGMTELFRPVSYSAGDDADAAEFIGRAVPGVALAIVAEDGSRLADGQTGELLIRSPARFSGYLDKPDETAAVLDGEWFRTGDLAVLSELGYVRIVGRKKDIILRGGYSVAAAEIEAVLESHPDIAEAAVIGVAHPELGEEIAAFVAPRPGAALDADAVIAYCKRRLASYKYPRQLRIVAELPKGPTGKVMKARLKP